MGMLLQKLFQPKHCDTYIFQNMSTVMYVAYDSRMYNYNSIFVSHSHSTPLLETFLADCINLNEVGFKMTSGRGAFSLAAKN